MKKQFIFLTLLVISLLSTAQTTVPGGYVSGNWTLAGSPYLIQGSVMVPKGSTLTIQPGVKVNFQGHYKLLVSGRLLAEGTAKDSILFTAANTTTGWYGIRFDNTDSLSDSSKISYAILQWGIANGTGVDQWGGALLFNNFSKVHVSHSSLKYNSNYHISCIASHPKISYCTIAYSTFGGAIWLESHSVPVITNNVIFYNKGMGIYGGGNDTDHLTILGNTISYNDDVGINIDGYSFIISNNIISYNNLKKSGFAGGIRCSHASGTTSNNTIIENYGGSGYGGGISYYYTPGAIFNNLISNNNSDNGAGIFCCGLTGNPTISNNVIVNNTSTGKGGGIFCFQNCSPILINNTISNNTATYGGGLYCGSSSNPALTNCIFYGNTATVEGAQVQLDDETSDPAFIYCNIQGGSAAFGLNGNFFSGTYAHNIKDDPRYIRPSTGSGSTYEGFSAKWSLQDSSPCINAGDSTGINTSTDIAGNPRVKGTTIDIGAYEWQGPTAIHEEDASALLSIYPNPFNDYTTIQLPAYLSTIQYTIYDVYGQMIKSGYHSGGSSLLIQKENWSAGVYFIAIAQGSTVIAKGKLMMVDQ